MVDELDIKTPCGKRFAVEETYFYLNKGRWRKHTGEVWIEGEKRHCADFPQAPKLYTQKRRCVECAVREGLIW